MKKLLDLIEGLDVLEAQGDLQQECTLLTADSGQVSAGGMFVAVRGTRADGHEYIPQALANGARALVVHVVPASLPAGVACIRVEDTARALGLLASAFYDHPSSRMKLVGVTGTNGKTTIATLLFNLFGSLGFSVGLFSTVCNRINKEILPSTHTTPDPVKLNETMARMVAAGCSYCFMEVSSHSVVQHRIAGLTFAGGIFTNLTRDHLDYHKTFAEYLKAKQGFFDALPASAFALTNLDDRNGRIMVQNTAARVSTYSTTALADYHGQILENQLSGMLMSINGTEAWFRLVGSFNAANLLAIYGAACLLGMDAREALTALSALDAVEGRFDSVRSQTGITAIVDYAHTPDALQNVLRTLQSVNAGKGRIITVVGAGGDRDPGKRPMMARIACELSDQVILTSDNPRSEDPESIIAQMKAGVEAAQLRKVLCITDRREAIRTACALATAGDAVLVAGKGHEKYQEIRGVKHPFDDKEILRDILTTK